MTKIYNLVVDNKLNLATTVLMLCLFDSYSTLFLLSKGATEANPVMQSLLDQGPLVFLLVKGAITVVALYYLVNARKGYRLLKIAALLYGALGAYHVVSIAFFSMFL